MKTRQFVYQVMGSNNQGIPIGYFRMRTLVGVKYSRNLQDALVVDERHSLKFNPEWLVKVEISQDTINYAKENP
jgi:hypothetical protein